MKIYGDYLETIKNAIDADANFRYTYPSIGGIQEHFDKAISFKDLQRQLPKASLLPSLEVFANELDLKPNFNQKLGEHPDFSHLKTNNEIEKHYIVSQFIDIKGSTNLFKRYNPETVYIISNTIQRAAIHTCLIFGGYIHRLQGDGLFVYYGGKSTSIPLAVKSSLISASMFTYFVKNDIKSLFNEQGIEDIYTRIGIDLGNEEDVVWALAGIGDISEVTTFSLHTSLASKMQSNAASNGIVVGDNIINEDTELPEFTTPVCQRTNNENDRYIFQIPEKRFRYTQHDLHWLKFLKRQPFIATDMDGNLVLKRKNIHLQSKNIESIAMQNKPYFSKNKGY